MSEESKENDLVSVVDELRAGLEDGSIVLDRTDDKISRRTVAEMHAEAERFVRKSLAAAIGAAVAASVIPGSSMVMGVETSLTYNIARIYGFYPSMEECAAIAAHLSGSVLGKMAVEAISFVPIIGWAIKSSVLGSTLTAFAKAAVDYFEKGAVEAAASSGTSNVEE